MRKIVLVLVVLLMALACCVIVGCGKSPGIPGKYEVEGMPVGTSYLYLEKDGKASSDYVPPNGDEPISVHGKWSYDGKQLKITWSGDEKLYTYKVSGDTLVWTGPSAGYQVWKKK
jgi:Lipocalin-like domain